LEKRLSGVDELRYTMLYGKSQFITLRIKPSDRKALLMDAESKGLSISSYLLECWKKARD